jgi:hypothetical protein
MFEGTSMSWRPPWQSMQADGGLMHGVAVGLIVTDEAGFGEGLDLGVVGTTGAGGGGGESKAELPGDLRGGNGGGGPHRVDRLRRRSRARGGLLAGDGDQHEQETDGRGCDDGNFSIEHDSQSRRC